MDGAWALYEAWVHLQSGHVDSALVFGSGISSRGDLREVLCLQNDPYYLMPLWADHVSLAALQARAVLEATGGHRGDLAEIGARCQRPRPGQPLRPGVRRRHRRRPARRPLRGGAAAGGRLPAGLRRRGRGGARRRRPGPRAVRAPGLDPRPRPPHRAALPRASATSPSASPPAWPARRAGVGDRPIQVAELSATFSHEELLLRAALGLGDDVAVNPSGGRWPPTR